MSAPFQTFKTFPDSDTAGDFAAVLEESGIPYLIEEDALVFDPSYANNPLQKDYLLKLRPQDFDNANQALERYYEGLLHNVPADYYLYSFTDEELQEIVAKPDEWGHLDYQLAKKLLAERGKSVAPQQTERLRKERMEKLSMPETVQTTSIVLNYFVAVFFFPVGLFIGWHWANGKKTLPDGARVPIYTASVQKHGLRIFFIAAVMLTITILGKVFELLP